ncbi:MULTISPECIES: NADPH-dependent FMN reductase family protein [Methanosarcina]|uniref:Flavodoxin n=3 Tax=Methanosarcina barkeri TaxID=2208 RepID=A0A0E3QS43_METBA|nr:MULTISPECIES: hypothetical protein [Methanosarcina]AKB53268.1 Flavodoxin [Methanosarcina barkeri MS]AKB58623.1 Flavodoxin [Methanosarcina barkeri 227]AKJ39425.1 hypothetical protein MCM1_2408 [Methanosarcina barkeri CM1]OED06226.1 hypothetical protein A9239_01445 [Methanosarcina sp. A14]
MQSATPDESAKNFVAYFSHPGNMCEIANQINENAGVDLFEIVLEDPYPSNYSEVVEQVLKELGEDTVPG